ncbi:MAG: cbb3-type cytochrome oxidase assembly protein CcoS [Weeksellaceae bacterium]
MLNFQVEGRTFVGAMGIVMLMIMVSVTFAVVFLALFILGARDGQFDEDESPAVRMLMDDKKVKDKIDT